MLRTQFTPDEKKAISNELLTTELTQIVYLKSCDVDKHSI